MTRLPYIVNIRAMGLLPDAQNCGLRMRGECREHFPCHRLHRKRLVSARHASRHVRHARAVMHVEIANPRWRGKRSRHSRRMRNPQFCVSGKRPIEAGRHKRPWHQRPWYWPEWQGIFRSSFRTRSSNRMWPIKANCATFLQFFCKSILWIIESSPNVAVEFEEIIHELPKLFDKNTPNKENNGKSITAEIYLDIYLYFVWVVHVNVSRAFILENLRIYADSPVCHRVSIFAL